MWRNRLLVECMVDVSGDFEGLLGGLLTCLGRSHGGSCPQHLRWR